MSETVESETRDVISLDLRGGNYELKVIGDRNNQRQKTIVSIQTTHFDYITSRLSEYHIDCLTTMSLAENKGSRKGGVYLSTGSGRGDWFEPWIVEWKLELKCQLLKYQEKTLNNIVYAHNWHVRALVELEKMQLENKLTATHHIL